MLILTVNYSDVSFKYVVPSIIDFRALCFLFDLLRAKAQNVNCPMWATIRTDWGCYFKGPYPDPIFKSGEDYRIPLNHEAEMFIKNNPIPT